MARLRYLVRCLAKQVDLTHFLCPNCGHTESGVVDRKYLVTQLRRCGRCSLLFRTPTDDPTTNQQFYEGEYAQGFTTELPSESALTSLIATNFAGTEKDYAYYIVVLRQLGLAKGARIFDFGCSWGYGSYQLMRAGYDVVSFEIDRVRGRFAQDKLEVRLVNDLNTLLSNASHVGQYDCFFAAHVLEHVPCPAAVFGYARKLLAPNGLFVSFTPNGSAAFRKKEPAAWSKLWGEVHPNFIDDVCLDVHFQDAPRAIGSSPVSAVVLPTEARLCVLDSLDRSELMFVARPSSPRFAANKSDQSHSAVSAAKLASSADR
jgi:2-polyprenyl-3-methyl-5-hydroxy-6-metoxy-1,4-benzoquinol methylase